MTQLPHHHVLARLYETPAQFSLLQAIRLIDWQHFYLAQQHPELAKKVNGRDFLPEQEQLNFISENNLTRIPTDIVKLRKRQANRPDVMQVSFMGLTGVNGSLPIYATEELLFAIHYNEFALRNFYDLFNHRAISFYHLAQRKYRVFLDYETTRRQSNTLEADAFTVALQSLIGTTTSQNEQTPSPDKIVHPDTFLYYDFLLSSEIHSAQGLQDLLTDYFFSNHSHISIQILELQEKQLNLPTTQQLKLPSTSDINAQFNQLGVDTMLGESYTECQSHFRIRISPLDDDWLLQFLPTGRGYTALVELTKHYISPQLSFDIELIKAYASTHDLYLNSDNPARLGWNTHTATTDKTAATLEPIVLSVE